MSEETLIQNELDDNSCKNNCRQHLKRIAYSECGQRLNVAFLLLMIILVGFLIYWDFSHHHHDGKEEVWFVVLELLVDCVIIVEVALRMFYMSTAFWRSSWLNYLDVLVGTVCLASLGWEIYLLAKSYYSNSEIEIDAMDALRIIRDLVRMVRLLLFVKWLRASVVDFGYLENTQLGFGNNSPIMVRGTSSAIPSRVRGGRGSPSSCTTGPYGSLDHDVHSYSHSNSYSHSQTHTPVDVTHACVEQGVVMVDHDIHGSIAVQVGENSSSSIDLFQEALARTPSEAARMSEHYSSSSSSSLSL